MGYHPGNGRVSVDVVRCEGNLDAARMVLLKNRLARLVSRNHKFLLLDMKRARHIDAAGISILVDRIQKVRHMKGDVRLFNLHPRVSCMLNEWGVNQVVETFGNEEEAVKSFSRG